MKRSKALSQNYRITLVTNIFYPDELGGAALFTDMASYLRERGVEINVVTTFSYYPRWEIASADKGVWKRELSHNGIPVTRVRMYVPGSASAAKRMLSDLSYCLSLATLGRSAWKNSDLIITACPMFGQLLAVRMAKSSRVPKMAVVQDFVVDAALELGMIKNPSIGRLLKRLERWVFRGFDTITTISDEMQKKLMRISGSDRRTLLIPNWIHGSLQTKIDEKRDARRKRHPATLFYSGNVGRKQGLPEFIETFKSINRDWHLHINGGGAEFSELQAVCEGRADVVLSGLQEEESYIESLLTHSACLVTQKPGVSANFLPSKILPALASGTPILAACERFSPLGREVLESGCGEVVEPGDSNALAEVLKRWSENPEILEKYSKNSLKRSLRYNRETVLQEYLDEMNRLLENAYGSSYATPHCDVKQPLAGAEV